MTSHSRSWRKSSYSGGNNGNCVEVAPDTELVGVRDSKAPASGELAVPAEAWTTFLRQLS
ncbi:DUF397 domain-containing protein [Amycolatopsis sp. NPDC051102]|uniref:DUF397 domain-containing protein n=1 Tax=Amycolatopsis sp. NPDC051102 TaxID=3155163 RepID=UPI003428CD81